MLLLAEGKERYRLGKNPELRAAEARAHAIVQSRQYTDVVARKTKETTRKVKARKERVRNALSNELTRVKQGTVSKQKALDNATAEIRAAYNDAFSRGLEAQGHGTMMKYTSATPDRFDKAQITSAVKTQRKYLKGFIDDVHQGIVPDEEEPKVDRDGERSDEPSDEPKPRKMRKDRRVNMYVQSVDAMFTAGQVAGAPEGSIIHWIMAECEHCPECLLLSKYSPYTKESLPTVPRAGDTRCLSNCKCRLAFDLPKRTVFEAFEKIQRERSYYRARLRKCRSMKKGLPELRADFAKLESKTRLSVRGR